MPLTSFTAALRSASVVGVSGARAPSPASLSACRWALGQLAPSATVVTGCASGVDACARSRCPAARVLHASAFGGVPAARSVAVVRAVAAGAGPGGAGALWLAFPSGPCPSGRVRGRALAPSRSAAACFAGYGSGTWASLALAIGLGVPCLVFLPAGVAAPTGWGLAPVAGCAGHLGLWVRAVAALPSLFP